MPPSDFAASAKRFANQGARHTAAVYGGNPDDGSCDAQGNNLQLVGGSARKFRAAFNILRNEAQAIEMGFSHLVQAAISLPAALKIPVTVEIDGGASGTEFVYLPTGDTYRVTSAKGDPITGNQRLGLRRIPATP